MGTILQCRAPKSRRTVEVMLAKVAAASIWIDRPLEQTTVRLTAERHPKISEGYFHRGPLKRMFFTKSNGNHHRHTHTHRYSIIMSSMVWYGMQFDLIWLCLELPSFESHGGMANRFPLARPICSRPMQAVKNAQKVTPEIRLVY